MQEIVLDVNGEKTTVLTFDGSVQEHPGSNLDEVILIIPGNPGITSFYKMFMHTLYEKTKIPVWIVGHAGHEITRARQVFPITPLSGNEDRFGLQGQIAHKMDFIQKFFGKTTKIHLIGHSIGAYIALELLKDNSINSRVVDVNLLFPTIEFMGDTPNGKFMLKFVKPIVWLVVFLSMIFTMLPGILSRFLLTCYMKCAAMPQMHFRTIYGLVQPSILEKVFFLAFQELDGVKSRNDAVISSNLEKIRLLYGQKDGWAPVSYCDRLKNDFAGVKAEVSSFDHSFVLWHSREVGAVVAAWLKDS